MAKELPYLSSYKNVEKLFQTIDAAKRPESLTTRVLADTFGLKSTNDRQLITLLKTMGFLDQSGRPTAKYDLLKNPDEAKRAIAEAIRRAYEPLFEANESAHTLSGEALRGLIAQVAGVDKNLTTKIAGTFNSLVRLADFSPDGGSEDTEEEEEEEAGAAEERAPKGKGPRGLRPEFHYNIQVHLPANGTEETYLHIFNALRKVFK